MYYTHTDISSILQSIESLNPLPEETLLILFGEESQLDLTALIDQLNERAISFCGGVFPGIIFGRESYTTGYILKKLPLVEAPLMIQDLNTQAYELPDFSAHLRSSNSKLTMLTFVDGLTANIAGYLNQLYHKYGNSFNFLGGGAGSLSLVQQPCVFSNEGIFQDAALMCLVDMEVSLGVKHGWKQMIGPFVATKTSQNTVHELNWSNAFEVYREAIREEAGADIRSDNFFEIAKGFPFGIFKENGESVVRDPIAVDENGSLICVGEVPPNTVLYILKGERENLIDSADLAIKECVQNAGDKISHTLVVDCISRTLFLEEEFSKELNAINNHKTFETNLEATPQGILSLGEISSNGEGFLEFYNKTLVIGALFN